MYSEDGINELKLFAAMKRECKVSYNIYEDRAARPNISVKCKITIYEKIMLKVRFWLFF